MEPGSRGGSLRSTLRSAQSSPHKLANVMGTVVALLTLTVPLFTIAHFSSPQQTWQTPAQLLPSVRR
jgi:hypothetical protein